MRHWDMLYGRPPLGLDAALFALAIALHAPLLLLSFKAPPKMDRGQPRTVKIELLDQLPEKVFSNPISVKPNVGPAIKNPIELPQYKELIQRIQKARASGDLLPPIKPRVTPAALPKQGLGTGPIKVPDKSLANKGAFTNVTAPALGSGPAGLKGGGAAAGPAASGRPLGDIGAGSGPTLADKGSFSIKSGQIGSIGSGDSLRVGAGGGGGPISIKTTKTGSMDAAVLAPIPVQDKGRFGDGLGDGSGGGLKGGGAQIGIPGGTGAGAGGGGGSGNLTGSRLSQAQRPAFLITGPLTGRQVIYQERPDYPAILRTKGIEGAVHLRFIVTAEGNVKDVSIVRTSGYRDMDMSAIKAIRKWSFVPLDRYEDQEGTIIMTFSLR